MVSHATVRSAWTSWRLTRWLLFYLAMLLADAAVVVRTSSPQP